MYKKKTVEQINKIRHLFIFLQQSNFSNGLLDCFFFISFHADTIKTNSRYILSCMIKLSSNNNSKRGKNLLYCIIISLGNNLSLKLILYIKYIKQRLEQIALLSKYPSGLPMNSYYFPKRIRKDTQPEQFQTLQWKYAAQFGQKNLFFFRNFI